jgi:hypothetical protein
MPFAKLLAVEAEEPRYKAGLEDFSSSTREADLQSSPALPSAGLSKLLARRYAAADKG